MTNFNVKTIRKVSRNWRANGKSEKRGCNNNSLFKEQKHLTVALRHWWHLGPQKQSQNITTNINEIYQLAMKNYR